jgi:hypothetical protein
MSEKVKKGHGEHGLPMTEGQFKVRGLVAGTKKGDKFFSKMTQKNGFERNTVNFAVKTSEDNEVYVQISDSEKEDAFFYKKSDVKGEKGTTKKISWGQRKNFKEEGFTPIGVIVGLDKDENNKNVSKSMFDYDAAEYLSNKVEDDMVVMIIGELEFSSNEGENGRNRYKKLKIKKIYNSVVDFSQEDFKEESYFKQKCLFMDITQAKIDNKVDTEDPRWIVKAKIVTYKTLEDIEFIIRNKTLASNFRKHLKPYNRISIHGIINNKRMAEEVQNTSTDDWGGESDPFNHINSPRKFEFEIIGIDTKDIDTKTYTEEIVINAFKAQDEFGSENPPWDNDDTVEDDDTEW